MKRSRWPHTVVVQVAGLTTVQLACTGCPWKTEPTDSPTISRLTIQALEHRQSANPRSRP